MHSNEGNLCNLNHTDGWGHCSKGLSRTRANARGGKCESTAANTSRLVANATRRHETSSHTSSSSHFRSHFMLMALFSLSSGLCLPLTLPILIDWLLQTGSTEIQQITGYWLLVFLSLLLSIRSADTGLVNSPTLMHPAKEAGTCCFCEDGACRQSEGCDPNVSRGCFHGPGLRVGTAVAGSRRVRAAVAEIQRHYKAPVSDQSR